MALIQLKKYKINVDIHEGLFPHDVIFVHGNLASNAWWQPSLEVWRKGSSSVAGSPPRQGRAICVEWRGCGRTTGPASAPHSLDDIAPKQLGDDLVELAEVLKLARFDLVGHSLGGLICLFATLRAPELVSKLVLVDSVGATGVQFPQAARDAFLQMKNDRAFCEAVMSGTIHRCDTSTALFKKIVDDTMGIDPMIWSSVPDVLQDVNILKELVQIQCPTLVLHGDQDPVLPKEDSIILAKNIRGAKYVELKDHGHSPNVESPAEFVSMLNGFLF